MSKRFTETDKWKDTWFLDLKPSEKLLWFYILDNCDNAGFFEFNMRLVCFMTGMTEKQVEGAVEGLNRGLIGAKSGDLFLVKNFLRHQKNDTLNPDNNAHKQIIRIINEKDELFKENLGATMGLPSPTGKGKGKGLSFSSPSLEDVIAYATSWAKKHSKDESTIITLANEGFEYYERCNWVDTNNRKVKNWKNKFSGVIFTDSRIAKVMNKFTPPTVEEAKDELRELKSKNKLVIDKDEANFIVHGFINHFNSTGWKGIVDWKSRLLNWVMKEVKEGKIVRAK